MPSSRTPKKLYSTAKKAVENLLTEPTLEYIRAPIVDNSLHKASLAGDFELVKLLLKKLDPKIINAPDASGNTALHYATKSGDIQIVELLLKQMNRSATESANRNGATVLHVAAENEHVEVVKILLANLNPSIIGKSNNCKWTALHIAASNGNKEIVEQLLASMLMEDINITSRHGAIALDIAHANGDKQIFSLILFKISLVDIVHWLSSRGHNNPDLNSVDLVKEYCAPLPLHLHNDLTNVVYEYIFDFPAAGAEFYSDLLADNSPLQLHISEET